VVVWDVWVAEIANDKIQEVVGNVLNVGHTVCLAARSDSDVVYKLAVVSGLVGKLVSADTLVRVTIERVVDVVALIVLAKVEAIRGPDADQDWVGVLCLDSEGEGNTIWLGDAEVFGIGVGSNGGARGERLPVGGGGSDVEHRRIVDLQTDRARALVDATRYFEDTAVVLSRTNIRVNIVVVA